MDHNLRMSKITKAKLIVSIDNFTFYVNSNSFYLTAKTVEPYIVDNKIVIEKTGFCQLKFNITAENFAIEKIVAFRYIQVEVEGDWEKCTIKGVSGVRWSSVKFIGYENNYRNFDT